ncbi:PAS domain-containing protein [Radicibacter daui]|uniref:PAS domain-containing protein n=1 Tax=Radicibacter daui TaxID=3064829 RepID=UPI004046A2F4
MPPAYTIAMLSLQPPLGPTPEDCHRPMPEGPGEAQPWPAEKGSTGSSIIDSVQAYWQSVCPPDQPFPARADIDPVALGGLLPFLFLTDVIEAGRDFRYRLVGTDIVNHTVRDNTGRLLSQLVAQGSQYNLARLYAAAVKERQPMMQWLVYETGVGLRRWYQTLVLPLSADGQAINMLLGVAVHYQELVAIFPVGSARNRSD